MRANLNISLYSYLDRPIFDVYMNGTDFLGASARAFYGSNGVLLDQAISLGPQKVTWRLGGPESMVDNGKVVTAKNTPVLKDIPKDIKWLALHIYDDETVEITLSKGTPDELDTVRGHKIIEAWDKRHGK